MSQGKKDQYSERSKDHRSRWNKADFRIVPELTTIQQPVKQIAKVAVDKLIDLIEGKTAESCMDLPVKLLEGQTT